MENKTLNNFKRNVDLSISLNRWILKPIGAWPSMKPSKTTRLELIFKKFLILICYILLSFVLVFGSMFIILELEDFYNSLKIGSALSFFLMAAMKYFFLIIRENDIRNCLGCIEMDWKYVKYSEDKKIMVDNANFGRKLIKICGFFMYGGVVFYYIALPMAHGRALDEDRNITYRPLVYPIPKIIANYQISPANEIFYLIQLFSGLVAHNITVAACGIVALLAMHACGQLEILISWLEYLVDGRENVSNTFDERLADIVEQHVRAFSFIKRTEEVISEISLVEIVGCTFNICCLGYHCMMEWDIHQPLGTVTYVILLISVTFNIFIFCYIGEVLAEQTLKVGEKSYMIDWYRIPDRKNLALVLIIMTSNSTTRLTAGNLIDLSISSFSDVIKSAGAYLNMLRTFTI
ncbi:odorant receptor 45b-like [Polistes fuscatus]|uniref:odorant receptor 45b-like n=1 Tax=Polistes fuscatus TaxID=30207 RepID=UPI001CA81BE1|nr:odorant receptor 45b-like [Polistes fuscatus]